MAAALLAFAAVFLGVRALDGLRSLTGQPQVAVREGELPGATTAQRIEGLQAQVRDAGDIAPRPIIARHQAQLDWI